MNVAAGEVKSSSTVNSGAGDNPFEGPEKTLEIDFVPTVGPSNGLRDIPKEKWEIVVSHAKATILSTLSNEHCDSYLLSESSLFVYSHKVVIKTCGTTTLLGCVPSLVQFTKEVGLQLEWIGYTRKNLLFPQYQVYPHQDFQQECNFLKEKCGLEGEAYVLGPLSGEHWFIYVWDHCERPMVDSKDRTLNIMMYGLDEDVAKLFWKADTESTGSNVQKAVSAFQNLLPGKAQMDDFLFDPCGYSMNGLMDDGSYETIHITPEKDFSYASFETNFQAKSYNMIVKKVLAFFKPKRFTMTFFADEGGLAEMKETPFDHSKLTVLGAEANSHTWVRQTKSVASFAADYHCILSNFVKQ